MKQIDENEKLRLESNIPNKNFCPAPFLHSYVNANNKAFKLCCMSHVVGRWNNKNNLQAQHTEFWSGDIMQNIRTEFIEGKMPSACDWWCGKWEREGLYHKSDRLDFIQKYENEIEPKLKNINWSIEHGTDEYKKPIDLDLRPSKICNLKCRSCNSIWSDKIENEVLQNPEIQNWSHWDMIPKDRSFIDKSKIINWRDPSYDVITDFDFTDVYRLNLSGGETFVDKRVIEILYKLVENNQANKIKLHIITNCTILPTKIIRIIEEFKEVSFNISIDGIGATDEFLRDGTVWNKKEKIFNKIFNIKNLNWAGILHVIQPISAFQIKRNTEWFLEGYRKYRDKHNGVLFNPIVDPWYLSVSWLDVDHKDYIRNQISECIRDFDMKQDEYVWFDTVISELDKTQNERNIRYANDFVRAETALNKIRKTDTLTIEPMLQRYFDRYDETNITDTIKTGKPGAPFNGQPKPTV